mmetsp:Transcript_13578/g.27779  ORF Transcript_13578/g.27779 Transcript_13578/m.27779 type:complete len:218 (+) Transcript_13578:865-1518(+)
MWSLSACILATSASAMSSDALRVSLRTAGMFLPLLQARNRSFLRRLTVTSAWKKASSLVLIKAWRSSMSSTSLVASRCLISASASRPSSFSKLSSSLPFPLVTSPLNLLKSLMVRSRESPVKESNWLWSSSNTTCSVSSRCLKCSCSLLASSSLSFLVSSEIVAFPELKEAFSPSRVYLIRSRSARVDFTASSRLSCVFVKAWILLESLAWASTVIS